MNRRRLPQIRGLSTLCLASSIALVGAISCSAQDKAEPDRLSQREEAKSQWKHVAADETVKSTPQSILSDSSSSRRNHRRPTTSAPAADAQVVETNTPTTAPTIPIRSVEEMSSMAGARPTKRNLNTTIGDIPAIVDSDEVTSIAAEATTGFASLASQSMVETDSATMTEKPEMMRAVEATQDAATRKFVSPDRFRIKQQIPSQPVAASLGDNFSKKRSVRIQDQVAQEPPTAQDEQQIVQELLERMRQPIPEAPLTRLEIVRSPEDKVHEPERFTQGVYGTYPENAVIEYGPRLVNYVRWQPRECVWSAPDFYHQPLYFEEANLERYGQHYGRLQPIHSAAHFFVSAAWLPFKTGVYSPCERIYTLGHYRPGSCNPAYLSDIPVTQRAVLHQSLTALGAIYIVP